MLVYVVSRDRIDFRRAPYLHIIIDVRSLKHSEEQFMKNFILKIINPLLGVLLINQVLMGLLHDILPHKIFEIMHEGGGIVFAVVALLHVILNWRWIKANFFRKPSSGTST